MEVKTEPAGRLYDILSEVKRADEKLSSRNVWAKAFDVSPNDTSILLRMLAELIQLADETKNKIERIEDIDHKLYLKPFKKLDQFFSKINLDAGWKPWKDMLDDTTIYGLQFCSDKLHRSSNYTKIGNEQIESIKVSLNELTEMVVNSDIDQSLKELIVSNLEYLRQSLLSYKIRGIDGIQQAIELNLGSIILHKQEIKAKSKNGDRKKFWDKYASLLDNLNKTISAAKAIKELGGADLLKLLGFGDG